MSARILLVEDNKAQAHVITEYLRRSSYTVTWVQDGNSAIKTAATQPFDVILLDLILPDISGIQICRWLKQNKSTRGIPTIILTAKDSMEEKVLGLESGADDYLLKPYNESELTARIYASLRTKALQDELREKNRQLEELLGKVNKLAITDSLTELYNRRYFETVLSKEYKKIVRYGVQLSCLMIDIDYFKKVNDEFGHKAGDAVLKEIAGVLSRCIRDVDTLSRWGGEEFAVLLPLTDKEGALKIAARILAEVSAFRASSMQGKQVTVSIGAACAPSPSADSEERLISLADEALYKAKKNGRNRVECI